MEFDDLSDLSKEQLIDLVMDLEDQIIHLKKAEREKKSGVKFKVQPFPQDFFQVRTIDNTDDEVL